MSPRPFTLRDPLKSDDYERVAAVRSASQPDWPMQTLHEAGDGIIKTFNDKPNQAMLHMNEQLGFQRTATMYRYELHLDGQP